MPNRESFLNCLKLAKMPVGILLSEPRDIPQTQKNLVQEVRHYDVASLLH